jgi:hypothetical protein
LIYLTACSEEITPIYVEGKWDVYYFEKRNCIDSSLNVAVDLSEDSVYDINGRMVRFLSYEVDLFEGDSGYVLTEMWNIDNKDTTLIETGEFFSSGLNDIVFCVNECADSMFKNGIYFRSGTRLEMSWFDTLPEASGCGIYIKANQK